MLNEALVTLTGYVATQPVTKVIPTGATNLEMRVAWTPRWQDRVTGEWMDGNTSYITVICWRRLAVNVGTCVRKGDPVAIKGKLSVRNYTDKEGTPRTTVEVEASSVGHDLSKGVASFQRVRPPTGMSATEFAAAQDADGSGEDSASALGLNGAGRYGASPNGAGFGADGLSGGGEAAGTSWASSGAGEIPMPQEPDDAFFDESAIADVRAEPSRLARRSSDWRD